MGCKSSKIKTYTDATQGKITNICVQIYEQTGMMRNHKWTHDSLFMSMESIEIYLCQFNGALAAN